MKRLFTILGLLTLTQQWGGNVCQSDSECDLGMCCSQWGYCGQGEAFCGTIILLENGRCNSQQNCRSYEYCSQWGYCWPINWNYTPEPQQTTDLQPGQCYTNEDCMTGDHCSNWGWCQPGN